MIAISEEHTHLFPRQVTGKETPGTQNKNPKSTEKLPLPPSSPPASTPPHSHGQAGSRTPTGQQLLVGCSMHLNTPTSCVSSPTPWPAGGEAGPAGPSQVLATRDIPERAGHEV